MESKGVYDLSEIGGFFFGISTDLQIDPNSISQMCTQTGIVISRTRTRQSINSLFRIKVSFESVSSLIKGTLQLSSKQFIS